ncbi:hypothetical protein [Caudoviricetes sp.]|nr:hypothetical protein [Caudoviricetes sp.]
MSYTSMTRAKKFNQKREPSIFVAELKVAAAENLMTGDIAGVTGNNLLGILPANSIITNAYVFVRTVSNAATSAAATLGTADGGAQILTGINLKTAGKQGTLVGAVDTLTGVGIYLNRTITGAESAGNYFVVVEYTELTKTNGELTNVA